MDPLYWYYQEGMGPKHPGEHALLGKKKIFIMNLTTDWAVTGQNKIGHILEGAYNQSHYPDT